MTSRVTLNVFSGRPNPTWLLSEQEEEELAAKLQALEELTVQRPSGIYGGLGYRGFAVTRGPDHPQGALSVRVHEGIVERGAAILNAVDRPGLETWLADKAQSHVSAAVLELVRTSMAQPTQFQIPATAAVACPQCHAADAPVYNPGAWNVPAVQPSNNCYNYANDHVTNTFAQPGRATGHQYTALTCQVVQPAAQSDGLRAVSNFTAPLAAGQGWYVALVIWPNADFHWYRQDKVGCWSHKPGSTPVRNVDNAGNPITNPQTCNRGPYVNFCTFMVTHRGVSIR